MVGPDRLKAALDGFNKSQTWAQFDFTQWDWVTTSHRQYLLDLWNDVSQPLQAGSASGYFRLASFFETQLWPSYLSHRRLLPRYPPSHL